MIKQKIILVEPNKTAVLKVTEARITLDRIATRLNKMLVSIVLI